MCLLVALLDSFSKHPVTGLVNKLRGQINSNISVNLNPTWGQAALNADVVTASLAGVQWNKCGRLCVVYVNTKINISSNQQTILLANGIPAATFGYEPRGIVIDVDTGRAFVLKVTGRVNLSIYTGDSAPYQGVVAGFVVYVCN